MTLSLWTLVIAVITAVTCALCGSILVIKREALVSEGLSHAVLPGITIAFVVLGDRSSPLLILSAAATGLLMVLLVNILQRTGMVENDASLGIVFSAMFSVGIIVATQFLRNTHFHAHCIIDGNLAFAPLDTLTLGGKNIGPRSFFVMLAVLIAVLTWLVVFFKEIKLSAFDESLADSFGFRPALMHTLWLGLVSITTVAAFEIAGSILVVALMITPAAAATLLADRLDRMLLVSALLAAASAVAGFFLGLILDISYAGPIAAAAGAIFLAVLTLAPERGLMSRWRRRVLQRSELNNHLLLLRLAGSACEDVSQLSTEQIARELAWTNQHADAVVAQAVQSGFVVHPSSDTVALTAAGTQELNTLERSFL